MCLRSALVPRNLDSIVARSQLTIGRTESRPSVPPHPTLVSCGTSCDAGASAAAVYQLVCPLHRKSTTDALQALVLARHLAVANQLHLRLVRNSLQVRVQDAALFVARLVVPVSIVLRLGIERVCELELLLGRDLCVLEQQDRVLLVSCRSRGVADGGHTLYRFALISSICSGVTLSGLKPSTRRPRVWK